MPIHLAISDYLQYMRSSHRSTGSGRIGRSSALIMVVVGLLVSACGSSVPAATDTAAAAEAEPAAQPTANELLTGEFATFDDTSIDLSSLQGEDVVLWFWAPW